MALHVKLVAMAWLAPIWLLPLIPWMAVAIWMCIGRHDLAAVPFLSLWPKAAPRPAATHRFYRPPLAILLSLLAALLGIIAAAQPVLLRSNITRPLVVVVDRGLTMSAKSPGGGPRYVEMARQLAAVLPPWATAKVIAPGWPETHAIAANRLAETIAAMPSTALDDRQELQMQAAAARIRPDAPVVVAISDFPVPAPTITVGPEQPPRDVAIANLSARRQPQTPAGSTSSPQVMVRLLNCGAATRVHLHVQSDGHTQALDVEVPGSKIAGGSKNVFVDMPALGERVKAWIDPGDENPLDAAAWLVRQPLWPRIETHGNLPAPLRRMIQTYTRLRPADESSATVAVQDAALPLPDTPAVCLAGESSAAHIALSDHPQITATNDPIGIGDLDWATMLAGAALADMPAGWNVILQADGHPVLATHDSPPAASSSSPRQIWVGFISPRADRSVDYVIFWSKAINWLGGGGDQFTSIPVQPLDDKWKPIDLAEPSSGANGLIPGLYRAADNTLQAVNAKVEDMPFSPARPWRDAVRQAMENVQGQIALAPWLALGTLIIIAMAMVIRLVDRSSNFS